MALWQDRLIPLWAPHPSIEGDDARQKARLTAGLLFALVVLSALTLLLPTLEPGTPWPPSGRWLVAMLLVAISAAYGLTKAGHPNAGLVAAIIAMEAGTWTSRWALGVDGHGEPALIFLVLPVLLAGVLLPPFWAAGVAAGTLLLAWLLESAIDDRLGQALDTEDVSLGVLIVGVSALAVVASAMAQRQARQLDASVALLRQVTETIPEILFVVAADGSRVHYTSPAYEVVTGRTVAQSMADPLDWLKVVHPEDVPRVQASLASGKPDLEYRIVHPSGKLKHLRARTFPIVGGGGKVDRIVGIAEDVTAIVESQQRLREAQAQRIHLLQQLAHDLASPLSPVKIQLRLLQGHVDEQGQPGVAILKRNVEHIQRLVEDVKDVARLEGGELKLERREVDLAALAQQSVETLGPAASERGVQLQVDAPARLPAQADAGRVTQVLYNLVGNALKFTPSGGRIDIEAKPDGAFAVVSVRDSGAGMRPDQLAGLFKAFSQVHDRGTLHRPEDKGTGLGLYISKGIVEGHGGTIEAKSDGPGQGSTFTFRLPLTSPRVA